MRRGLLTRRIQYASAAALALALFIIIASGGTFAGRVGPLPDEPTRTHWSKGTEIGQAAAYESNIDYGRLDARLRRLVADDKMVGLAVGIVENGEIRFLKGYGLTYAGGTEPVTPNTIFRWASVSKGVAADMVAKLAEEERLSLYEPVARYSWSLRLPGGNEHKATVSDLLSHRLGLFGHANDSKLEDGGDPRLLRSNLATLDAICSPGQCHAYQNVAYDAASEIVEKVTGKSYEQAVREHLFLPLGMTSATLSRDGLLGARSWARPHRGGKNSKPVEVTDSYYRVPAAGGVNSSVKDLAIWMRAQMGAEPDVLPLKVLANVQSPRAATPGEQARKRKFRERLGKATYGLGWRIYDYAGHTVVGHHGGVTGYRSLIMFDPDKKAGVVALWNSSTAQPGGLEFEVMDMVYRLPPKDWLGLDSKLPQGAPPAAEQPATAEATLAS
ncbi:MAG TPA: serine hydrolase domain-containing protein [Allosphingosinicella sp.]|nr:serine hydrolase domain-containing protein [Allosphingosinicella sp.]